MESGNLPSFLGRLAPVTLTGRGRDGREITVTICVAPDYLAIGSDSDFLFVPMRLATALRIADRFGFTLPTSTMVDAIYRQAAVHLVPQPLPASDQMRSTAYAVHHNQLIAEQRRSLGVAPGMLTSGDKKDLVLTSRLYRASDRVAIYGWHRANREPIQPLSTVHGARYADYSHGVRLVSTVVYVGDRPRSIFSVLADPELAPVINSEGAMPQVTELLARLSVPPVEIATAPAGTLAP